MRVIITCIAYLTGGWFLAGCAAPQNTTDYLTERLMASQARLQEQMTASRTAYTESIAEALGTAQAAQGTAQAAQHKTSAIESSIERLAQSVKEINTAMATTQKDISMVAAQIKTFESTLRLVAAKADERASGVPEQDPGVVTIQLRVPQGPLGKGKKGLEVFALHRALHLAGVRVHLLDQYTKETEAAMKEFQRAEQLAPTGIYDTETAARLRHVLLSDSDIASPAVSSSNAVPKATEPPFPGKATPSSLPSQAAEEKPSLAKHIKLSNDH
jgi:peptidoglycan hydrolase-like protein with peptidoglycan-binding domain